MVGINVRWRPVPRSTTPFAWFSIWGRFLVAAAARVAVGERAKLPETTLQWEHSGVSRRGGVRHWLLYRTMALPVQTPGRWVS